MLSSSKGDTENKNDDTANSHKFLEYQRMKNNFIAQYWRTPSIFCNTKFIDKIIATTELTAKEKYALLMECCYVGEGGAKCILSVNFAIDVYANTKTINQYFQFLMTLHKDGISITELVNLLIGKLNPIDPHILGQRLESTDKLVSYYNLVNYIIDNGAEIEDALSLCAPNIRAEYNPNAISIYLDCLEKLRDRQADPIKIIELIGHILPKLKIINDEKNTQRVLALLTTFCSEKYWPDVIRVLEKQDIFTYAFSFNIAFSRKYAVLQQLFDLYDTLLNNGFPESQMLAHFAKLKLDSSGFSFSHAMAIHGNSACVLRYVSIIVKCHTYDSSIAVKLMTSLNKNDGHMFLSLINSQGRETVGAVAFQLIRAAFLPDKDLNVLKNHSKAMFEFVNKLPAQEQISIRDEITNENQPLGKFFRSIKSSTILEQNKALLAQLVAKEGRELKLKSLVSSGNDNNEEKTMPVKASLQVGGTNLFTAKYNEKASQLDKAVIANRQNKSQ
ncbi:MAG: hypothetical protein ABI597_10155 [Gammaproteobacteria bacterium]